MLYVIANGAGRGQRAGVVSALGIGVGGVVHTLSAALNPKVALFFLAFIPQFVDPSRGSVVVRFLLLGGIFNTSGTLVNRGAVRLRLG